MTMTRMAVWPAALMVLLAAAGGRADGPKPDAATITTTGAVEGRPFRPQQGRSFAKLTKNGTTYLVVELLEDPWPSCDNAGTPKVGSRQLYVPIPWEKGKQLDLANARLHGNWNPETMMEVDAKGRYDKWVKAWNKPTGTVTTVAAPGQKGTTGRIRIDLRMGDFTLKGEIPIAVCYAP
jgi:hypothetical protein